jgi:hypothetical protein
MRDDQQWGAVGNTRKRHSALDRGPRESCPPAGASTLGGTALHALVAGARAAGVEFGTGDVKPGVLNQRLQQPRNVLCSVRTC